MPAYTAHDELELLYQDDHYVAVNKPAGLLVHRSRIARDVRVFLLQELRNQVGQWVYPVHRLDRPTSGVLVFGLDPEAARRLGQMFMKRRVRKTYLAVVRGHPPRRGWVDHPLREPEEEAPREAVAAGKPPERSALTLYRRLAEVELPFAVSRYPTSRYALVALRPRTGRRHQLRRHMKHIAHPIVGDKRYGDHRHNRFFREHFGCRRLLLHACRIAFRHPFTGNAVVVEAGLDAPFRAIVNALGWGDRVP
ncbi:MAG: tRNA pseudouridine synthase TruC [Rhodothermaceae bacterium]|nr:MAG: tRNA pseudouridine synthase TruC [Rhodothermaceae bacterium]